MGKIKVGVAGYGTIGQRLADGVAQQEDMELVGIADLAPTLSLQALRERDMIGANGVKYNLYLVDGVPCVVDANGLFVQLGADIDGVPYIYNVYGELVPLDLDGIPGLREFYEEHLSPGVTEDIQEDAGSGEQGDAPATERAEDTAEISDTEEGIDE